MGDPRMKDLMDTLRAQPTFAACGEAGLKALFDGGAEAAGLQSPVRFRAGVFPMLQHHRRIDGRDFFWLANNSEEWRTCEIAVPSVRGAASIWDCETGGIRPVASTQTSEGSALKLVFKPYEAFWLVFDPKKGAHRGPAEHKPDAELITTIDGPWKVHYDAAIQPVMEYPAKASAGFAAGVEKPLEDWSAWGLSMFGGLLDYAVTIRLDKPGKSFRLDLGKVCHVAQVWVNGTDCGARLWGPYAFDIGPALRSGRNEIRVRVANLINDSYAEPAESGLFGPVRIIRER